MVNLAEKYQIQDLLEELVFQMEQYPLTMQTVLDITETAEQFTQFPKVSGQLLTNCSKFLKTNLKTDRLKLQFALDQSGKGKEKIVLYLLSLSCSNCRNNMADCMDGKPITNCDKIAAGMTVTVTTKEPTHSWLVSIVTVASVNPATNKIKVISPVNQNTEEHAVILG